METTRSQWGERLRFRPTSWPSTAVDVPAAFVRPVHLLHLKDAAFLVYYKKPIQRVSLPGELYLRELKELDLSNAEAIFAFSKKYGAIGWTKLEPLFDEVESALKKCRFPIFPVEALKQHGKGIASNLNSVDEVVSVKAFTFYAALIRDMTRAWELYNDQLSLSDFLGRLESKWLKPVLAKGGREWTVAILLGDLLNAGLRQFHVRIEIDVGPKAFPLGQPVPDAFALLCLQLRNHISQNVIYKQCANETCRKSFVFQRGRAKYDRHRTKSVSYCSNYCAKAQAQRERRRRQAKARQLYRQGVPAKEIAKEVGTEVKVVKGWVRMINPPNKKRK